VSFQFPSTRTTAIASALVALTALTACGSDSSSGGSGGCQDGKVKIGVLLPLSGPAAGFGQGVQQAIDFVAAETNKNGGIQVGDSKCTIELLDYDTKGTAEQASAGINKLISDGATFVYGPNLSHEVTAAAPIAVRNNVLMFEASYSSKGMSADMPMVFGAVTTPSGFSGPMTEWVAKTYPAVKKVSVVVPDNQGGKDTAGINQKAYEAAGIQASVIPFAEGTEDFAPFIDRLLRDKPDAVDLASTPPGGAGVMIKQLRQAGFTGPVGRVGGESMAAIINAVGSAQGLGDFFYYAPVNVESAPVKEYREQFKARFGKEPLPVSAQLLPSARLLVEAIDKADSTDTAEVAKVLEKLPIDDPTQGKGVWGGQEFYGINHEIINDFYAGRYEDGKVTFTPLKVSAK
jgi:branched-chain amino acid transport system substrate-binding protein